MSKDYWGEPEAQLAKWNEDAGRIDAEYDKLRRRFERDIMPMSIEHGTHRHESSVTRYSAVLAVEKSRLDAEAVLLARAERRAARRHRGPIIPGWWWASQGKGLLATSIVWPVAYAYQTGGSDAAMIVFAVLYPLWVLLGAHLISGKRAA